jgi:hypothetical protein
MSKGDIVSVAVILVCALVWAWCIFFAVRTGKWRYRGGIVHRDISPKLFWSIVTCAFIMEVFVIFIWLVMLNAYCVLRGASYAGGLSGKILKHDNSIACPSGRAVSSPFIVMRLQPENYSST